MRIGGRISRDGKNGPMKERNLAPPRVELLRARAARGNVKKALRILERAGVGNPPERGDKLKAR